jgi:XTP/dITP diphosphohydrolase
MTLYCATGNPGKLREFRLAAGDTIQVVPLPGLEELTRIEETGESFLANAIQKAVYYSAHAPGLLFADDSGLEVDALGGAPGVRSARFAGRFASDEANNRLLLEKLRGVSDRTARFVCAIAVAEKGRLIETFHGVVEGRILERPCGQNGFGYDPLFFYPPFGCSLAEVSADQKFTVSHRGQALRAMLEWVATHRRDAETQSQGLS